MALTYLWLTKRVRSAPYALEAARAVKQYGWRAVFGDRPATAVELREMTVSERLVNAWISQSRAENIVDWSSANPEDSALIDSAKELSEYYYGSA